MKIIICHLSIKPHHTQARRYNHDNYTEYVIIFGFVNLFN